MFHARSYSAAQEALWECVIQGAPAKESAHQLALTYRELKNYPSGLLRAKSAHPTKDNSLDLLFLQGFLHFRQGQHQESIRFLEQAYRQDQNDWRIHHLFGLNYVVLNIKDGALASFENAIRLNPGNAELYYQLARFYYSDNRVSDSIAASQRALAIFPDYAEAHNNLGLCYEALSEMEAATRHYEEAIALTKKLGIPDEWPFINYGAFLIKQSAAEKSLPYLADAISQNPKSAKAHYFLGRALSKLDRNPEARQALERSLLLDPKDPAPHFELGMLLHRQGDRARAKSLLERFEQLRKQETR